MYVYPLHIFSTWGYLGVGIWAVYSVKAASRVWLPSAGILTNASGLCCNRFPPSTMSAFLSSLSLIFNFCVYHCQKLPWKVLSSISMFDGITSYLFICMIMHNKYNHMHKSSTVLDSNKQLRKFSFCRVLHNLAPPKVIKGSNTTVASKINFPFLIWKLQTFSIISFLVLFHQPIIPSWKCPSVSVQAFPGGRLFPCDPLNKCFFSHN